MEGRTKGLLGNKKNRRLRTWRLDAAMDAITALTIKGVARASLCLSGLGRVETRKSAYSSCRVGRLSNVPLGKCVRCSTSTTSIYVRRTLSVPYPER